ncbi:MAG TPA: TonB-dependent receptor [Novosphingobium sp.]|nr:TonB-dependent receptor [Novosphingobium sp.]
MNVSSLLRLAAAPGALAIAALASPAFAQDGAPAATTADADCIDNDGDGACDPATSADGTATGGSIVVTGSRIRRPNLESTVPITSIAGDDFLKQATTNIGDTLNELPQLRSTFSQSNPGLGIGIAGLSLLDLRGLGTQRTLVLVNGRRHVPADILNNAVSPDVNTIPNDLIERVDIVTGGNSAVYGSDAIAGVVNFVLRRDFDGLQLRGSAAITQPGYGGNQYVSAMYGRNFLDGRGNITVHGEYAHQERIFTDDIPYLRSNDNLVVIDSDTGAGLVGGGDMFPDRAFFRDIRGSTIHYNGIVPINQRNAPNALCGNATLANNGGPNSSGVPFSCTFFFNDAGRLTQQTGTRLGTGINATFIGGNGQTGRERHAFSVLPFLERYNFNVLSHFELAPAAELFFEGKWNRVNALGNNAGPSFIQGIDGAFDFRQRPRLDNPFLNPADRTMLAHLLLTSGCRSDLQVTCPAAGNLTATDIANINNGSFRFVNARNLIDVGLRDEKFQRDTWRVVGGLRGTFNDDWNYELSLNYGKFREDITTDGFIDRQRFSLALDAGRNPLTGQIQCRSQFDPAAAIPIQRTDAVSLAIAAQNAARLSADIAACVPYNPFGSPDNSASIAYFGRRFFNSSGLSQFVASGFVGGDTSGFFNLPGGPVRFAVGAEYRREKGFYEQDDFTTQGFTNGVSIPDVTFDPFKVKEAFGEIQIPILKDTPFFEELTLSGAGRVAKYQGEVGTVFSYNAGIDYAPIRDIRFRGNYSRAVRAPNVSETGFPLVPNFSNGFLDPCNPAQRGSGVRAANCLADLGPTLLASLTDVTQSLGIVSGSNPNLTEEKSDSYTAGVVFQPRWVSGLNISVDYYNIKVKGVIANLGAQQIVNQCYDSPTLANIFCPQFMRFRGAVGTVGPGGEAAGRLLNNSLIVAPLNFASREREGIDVNASYRTNLTENFDLTTSLIYTHNLKISNFQDVTNPDFENRVLSELGDPKDEFRWDVDLGSGPFTLGYRMRYIGPQYVTTYEDLFSLNGLPPANIDFATERKYKAVFYHDLRFDVDVNEEGTGPKLNFYFGVENLLNRHPPLGLTGTGAGSAIYDFRGRSFFAGAKARF